MIPKHLFSEPYPFSLYAEQVIDQMKVLSRLRLREPIVWTVDWAALEAVAHPESPAKRNWKSIFPFDLLAECPQFPAIYYFTIQDEDCEAILAAFSRSKQQSLKLKRENGLKTDGFYNLCHVPTTLVTSSSLYAGSVKGNLASRLRQHLGFDLSGRTGALYLRRVLENLNPTPAVTFHAYILPMEFRQLTEHIEFVLQEKLKPVLGKRAFKIQTQS